MAVRSTQLALENLESRLNLSTLAGATFANAFARSGYSQERALFSAKTKVISLGAAAKKATASPLSALAGATSPAPAVSVSATTKSITVAWVNNSTNDTGFHIYRSTDGVNFKLLANAGVAKSSYTDNTATLGVSYIYRVTAYNKSTSTASGASQTVALALPPAPAAPSNLVDAKSTLNAITLAWKDNASNETGYHVYRSTDGQNYTLLTTLKPNAKSYTDTKLQAGTTYYYEVSAFNAGGETYAPTPFTAATLAAPPVAPTNLAFSNVGGAGVTLNWSEASTSVSGYRIYRSSNGKTFTLVGNVDSNTHTFADTGLNPLSTYSYEVSAFNNSANVLSKAASVSTLMAAPNAPGTLAFTNVTTDSLTLSWTPTSTNQTSFNIYRSTDGTDAALVGTVTGSTFQFTDTGLNDSTAYQYTVSAANAGGQTLSLAADITTATPTPTPNQSGPVTSDPTTPVIVAPAAPSTPTVSNLTTSSLTLNWTDDGTQTGIRIYRSTDATNYTDVADLSADATSWTDANLTAGTGYFYKIGSWNSAGETSTSMLGVSTLAPVTPVTPVTPIVVAPNAPTSPTFTNVTTSSATLHWSDTGDFTGYNVYRSTDGTHYTVVQTLSPGETTWTDTTLASGTTYTYAISAFNSAGETGSTGTSVSTLVVPPNAPASVTFAAVTSGGVTVNWAASANETGYNVYRTVDGANYTLVATTDANTTTFTDTGLNANTTYAYEISAFNAGGESKSQAASFATLIAAPNSPTSLAFTNVTTSSTTLNWNAPAAGGQTGFHIYRSTDGTNYTLVSTLASNATAWTDTTLAANSTYDYVVGAFNSTGESATTAAAVSTLIAAPNAPTSLAFTNVTTNGVTLNWTGTTGQTGYRVYRTVDGTNYSLVATTGNATTSWTDSGLNAGTTYAYEVSAFNTTGESKSQAAAVATLIAAPNTPGSLTFSNVTTSAATLSWSAPVAGGQTGYHVYRSTNGINYTLVSTLAANATTWTDSTLTAGSTYDYAIGAFNSTGEAATAGAAVSTLVAAPNTPSSVSFTNITTNSLTVNWSASNNETGYHIYRTTDGTNYTLVATTSNTTTSWNDTTVAAGTTYAYEVGAFNTTGESKTQATAVSTLIAAPNTPGSLSFTNVTTSSATLNWTAPGGQTGYHVYRSTNGSNYSLVGTLTAGATTWTDTALASGSTYFYAVGAYNGTGESTTPGASVSTLLAAPNAPAGVNFTNVTTSGVTLNWSAAPTATGYHVYRSTDGTNFTLVGTLNASTTAWSDTGLASNSSYYYSVGAFNTGGETRSANAFTTTLMVAPNAPTSLSFTNVTTTGDTLNWTASATATGYRIYRSTDGTNFALVATAGASATNWTDSGLNSSTPYYYEVGAFNAGGESKSAAASTVTQTPVVTGATVTFSTLNQTSFTELDITGTSGNDTIVVTQSGNVLTIVANGNTTTETGTFGDIKIFGVNGNDTITVQSSVNIATLIYGGDGNDIINNLTTGKATIVTIGNGTNTVTGNGINTSFWVNPTDTVHASAAEIALGGVNKVAGFYENVSRNLYGQNLTDPTDSGTETRLTNSSFWGTGPSMNDINQTGLADCYFEAPLAALAYSEPQKLMNMGVDLGDGTYAVRFYTGTTATYVRVDGDLSTGYWNYGLGNQTPGADGNQWGSIFEKAYAYFRTGANTYASLNYGYQGQTFTDLGVASSASFPSLTSAASMLSLINTQLAAGHSVVASTNASITAGSPIVQSHVYTILGAYMSNGTLMIQMRNPWGIDGFNDDSNPNDGLVTVAYSTFTANFNMVNYTTV